MFVCLLTLVLMAGQDVNSPPGTEMPNKDELIKTLREKHAWASDQLDDYSRRDTWPGKEQGVLESTFQKHGKSCRTHTRDHLGVERVVILAPSSHINLIKLPYDPTWKLQYQEEIDEQKYEKLLAGLKREVGMNDYGTIDFGLRDWGLSNLMSGDNPGAEITKVTAERDAYKGIPVYRFHFKREIPLQGRMVRFQGTMDVDPANSWAVVGASVGDGSGAGRRQDFVFEYEGAVHGRPAMKKSWERLGQARDDG